MATNARVMTLRLGEAEHTSKQHIARKAIREYLDQHPLDEGTLLAHGQAIMKRYGAVMQRLADG